MADILLSHGYFLHEDERELRWMMPYPPLGLLCLSAYLRRAGVDVDLFDSTFAQRSDLVARLRDGKPGIVGLYVNFAMRAAVLDLIVSAKNLGWTVILGGPEPSNYPEKYLEQGADVLVFGESEETMEQILALPRLDATALAGVDGLIFADERGQMVRTAARSPVRNLDSFPWPDREHIDMAKYLDVWNEHHGFGSVNLITARGCPYRCRWCSRSVFGYTYRRRSPADCADELQWLVNRYSPDRVWYADDVFTMSHKWLRDYSSELRQRDLLVPFETISRADRLMKEEVIVTLAEMGCWRIWIGSESGSQRILDRMERGVTVEQVQWATKAAQRHGIEVGLFLMWGYEGETLEDIEATVEHVRRAAPDTFLTTVVYPIKGTPYFNDIEDRVGMPQRWASATERDNEVVGRRPGSYYRLADDWLKLAVEADRAGPTDSELATRVAVARDALYQFAEND